MATDLVGKLSGPPALMRDGVKERMFGDSIRPIPQCHQCAHWHHDLTCAAFPEGIPLGILFNTIDHQFPFEGDHGIMFEKVNSSFASFSKRLIEEWIPENSKDPHRNDGPDIFNLASIQVTNVDAKDRMDAIDKGVVTDKRRGRFISIRSPTYAWFFWEGIESPWTQSVTKALRTMH